MSRQAYRGLLLYRRRRDHRHERQAADPAAPRAHRLRLPVLQPAADAHRGGEHPPAALDRGREARARMARGAARHRRDQRPPQAPPLGTLGRPAAARLDRPRPDLEAVGALRRRADRQPRLQHEQGRPSASPPLGRGARPDDRNGHPRRERSRARRSDPLPRRRPDRQGSPRLDGSGSARRHAGGERTMITVALKGLLGRKTRAVLTALAIVLGTGMVSATFISTATLNHAFNGVFSAPYKQSSVVVSGKQIVTGAANTPSVPASLVTRIEKVPGVKAASGGFLFATVKLVGANGRAIGNGGPQFGFGVDPTDKRFTPLALTTGRWPSGPGEIAIGAVTAAKEHFAVGDAIGAKGTGGVHRYTISGLAEIPGVSAGSATLAAFDVGTAQVLLGKQGRYDSISVVGSPDVTPRVLAARIRPLLSETETVRTSAAEAASVNKSVTGGLGGLKYILLAFGGIALFVGAFVIFNTISMTVAQRTRELATLRTLGASRRQVLRSVLLESAVIGALASLFGLVLGLALFKGLEAAALHRCGDDLESPRCAADPRRRNAGAQVRRFHGSAGPSELRT